MGGDGSRGNKLLPSARGSLGFDSPGQLATPSIHIHAIDPQPLPGEMQYGRKLQDLHRVYAEFMQSLCRVDAVEFKLIYAGFT